VFFTLLIVLSHNHIAFFTFYSNFTQILLIYYLQLYHHWCSSIYGPCLACGTACALPFDNDEDHFMIIAQGKAISNFLAEYMGLAEKKKAI